MTDFRYQVIGASVLPGSNYVTVHSNAKLAYAVIKNRTKRKPYIRSKYFKKQKIFFEFFWAHLSQKSMKEKTKRLRLFACAIELIAKTKKEPTVKINRHRKTEQLYRFYGLTKEKISFCVQIKENLISKNKYFMSVFPK